MNKEGVTLVDLRNVFSDAKEAVYIDDCHYNEVGADLIIDEIVKLLATPQLNKSILKRSRQ